MEWDGNRTGDLQLRTRMRTNQLSYACLKYPSTEVWEDYNWLQKWLLHCFGFAALFHDWLSNLTPYSMTIGIIQNVNFYSNYDQQFLLAMPSIFVTQRADESHALLWLADVHHFFLVTANMTDGRKSQIVGRKLRHPFCEKHSKFGLPSEITPK